MKCKCKPEETIGTIQVHCCNICGNPTEEWFTNTINYKMEPKYKEKTAKQILRKLWKKVEISYPNSLTERVTLEAMEVYANQFKSHGVLYGKDAKKFIKQMKENENKKASPDEIKRMKKNYEIMKEIIDKSNL